MMKRAGCVVAAVLAGIASGLAQETTLDELQGAKIDTVVKFSGYFRKATGEGPGYITQRMSTQIGPGDAVKSTLRREVTAVTQAGHKSAAITRSLSGKVGRPGQDDIGAFLWVLKDNSLVLLRTQEVGAQVMTVKFTRGASGLTCAIDTALAQEVGAGAGRTVSAFSGKVVLVSMKQTSASCSVSKGRSAGFR
jgi:hypothetical protein